MKNKNSYQKGRGSQINPKNRYLPTTYEQIHAEAIDDWEQADEKTEYLEEKSKTIVNKVSSPDLGMMYSLNPYQGCEHGCVYCYARNAHQYWGYSAGLDFERKIIIKKDAPALFRKFLENKKWQPHPICISGNTDCYQPVERKMKLTRQLLQIALDYRQPVSLITKNALILRDEDILTALGKLNLVMVNLSVTALDEKLRRALEPRTASYQKRLEAIRRLSGAGIPVGVMNAPVIPGLNDHEMPKVLQLARDNGACRAGYTIVRLNDAVGDIFKDWLQKQFPERFDKVWHLIQDCHGGNVNDSQYGRRMKGSGQMAEIIAKQFRMHCKRLGLNQKPIRLDTSLFSPPGSQLQLF